MNIKLIINFDRISNNIDLSVGIGNIHILIKMKADSSHLWKLVGGNA